jgi:hypothetical protein
MAALARDRGKLADALSAGEAVLLARLAAGMGIAADTTGESLLAAVLRGGDLRLAFGLRRSRSRHGKTDQRVPDHRAVVRG